MILKRKKKIIKQEYNKEKQKPIIRASICTGEKVFGFKDIETGKFEELGCIRSQKDLEKFMETYEIEEKDIGKEW